MPSHTASCHPAHKSFYIHDLSVFYDARPVITGLSLTVEEGEMISVMGPNGAGKSTLLQTLSGMHDGYSGQWGWIEHGKKRNLLHDERSYLAQRFEGNRQFPIRVQDVVAMGGLTEITPEEAMSALKLDLLKNMPIMHLSVGQFQRMLFARLYVQDACMILLDEPFSGLDDQTIEDLLHIILRWKNQGRLILMAHHNRSWALEYFPRSLLLARDHYYWGSSQDVLSLERWHQVHDHVNSCCHHL